MQANNNFDYYAGILCFNPLDDPYHLERIDNCIESIAKSANFTKKRVKIVIATNDTLVKTNENELNGVGPETKMLISQKSKKYNIDLISYGKPNINSCSRAYSFLTEYGKENTDAKKIVIFADDYIMPYFWFDIMDINFKNNNASFITPATSFVAQENLKIDINFHPDWDVRIAEKGDHKKIKTKTIYSGVKIEHIDDIAKTMIKDGVSPWSFPPSFETTVFKRELLEEVGPIHDEYFSCFYDNDYFRMIAEKNFKGLIAKNCFIFHYGKGGTKALYKETADEKFKESPVEHQLISDVNTWNRRWSENVKPWWGKK
mgnify:CR=1 FL=1|tara:strand:+ start:685 stop:1632 length:948 start_codon:yes stop_codon:yes gene_type:complete